MDQILVHVILAANPDQTWDEILLELKAANLSPASLELLQKTEARLSPSSLGRSGIAREPTGEQINLCYDFEYTPQECE